jgi:DNA-binding NarL/FixJ family response regulator
VQTPASVGCNTASHDKEKRMPTPTRVLIADDHEIVRRGLSRLLKLDPDLEVVGAVADGLQAVDAARRLRPHVVLMDLLMPELDGVEATRRIHANLPEVGVLALTSVVDDGSADDAVGAGAVGFVLKDGQADVLPDAIKAARAKVGCRTPTFDAVA